MAISYSLSMKRTTFGKESGKLYATAQRTQLRLRPPARYKITILQCEGLLIIKNDAP